MKRAGLEVAVWKHFFYQHETHQRDVGLTKQHPLALSRYPRHRVSAPCQAVFSYPLHDAARGPSFQNEALASSYFKLLNFAAGFSSLQIPSSLKSVPLSLSACLFLNLG